MLTDPEKQKLQAALEQLETERRRRIDEKVEKGEAVRVPALSIVVGASEEVGAAIKDKLAALRAAGETREIYFEEPSVIVTGVPRAGRDDEYPAALARGDHKASAQVVERPVETSSPTAPTSPPPLSAQVASESESEPRRV